jgi:hypothetical protein
MKTRTNNPSNTTAKILLLCFILFGASQLVVNSILTPLGTKLQDLNTEKDYLIEENRELSEQIAKTNSIRVIQNLSEKKLSLTQENNQTIIYIQDTSLMAER